MIKGWLRYAELSFKAKTGFGAAPVYGAVAAAVALLAALVFLTITAFIWLSERYGDLTAAAVLTGACLALAIASAVAAVLLRRQAARRAHRMLAAQPPGPRLDPTLIPIALEIGRMLGWKKFLPIAVIGFFAAGIAREWSNPPPDAGED